MGRTFPAAARLILHDTHTGQEVIFDTGEVIIASKPIHSEGNLMNLLGPDGRPRTDIPHEVTVTADFSELADKMYRKRAIDNRKEIEG